MPTTHEQREAMVITDLQASFPEFAGGYLWAKVPDGDDPPDFIAGISSGRVGLELVNWLDGAQMSVSKRAEASGGRLLNWVAEGWETAYQPTYLASAVISPMPGSNAGSRDGTQLHQEFWRCVEAADQAWPSGRKTLADNRLADLSSYPVLSKYVRYLRFQAGAQEWKKYGYCWIDVEGDGGAFDPTHVIRSLEQAIWGKIELYREPGRRAHLESKRLARLELLVHGDWKLFAHNTPRGALEFPEIAQAGATFYASQAPSRRIFDRVWMFNSLNAHADLNRLAGYPLDKGRLRWLAELWPNYQVDPMSTEVG
jgi:hypothetical protein